MKKCIVIIEGVRTNVIVENVSKFFDRFIQVVWRIKIVKIKAFGFESVEKTLDGRVVG